MKILISIVIILGLTAVAGSVIVGIKSFDGTVTSNPYEKGLIWDHAQKKKAALGWSADIKNRGFATGENEIIFSVSDRDGTPLDNPSVSAIISRPSTSAYDKDLKALKSGDGYYRAEVNFPLYGYWDVGIKVIQGDNNLLFKKRIFIEKGQLK